jgi:hypothetical protein
MKSLPKQLILKRGETIFARMSLCRPSGEMFWLACDFAPTEAYAEIGTLIDEVSKLPDSDEGYERSDAIYAEFHDSGIRLVNPDTQEYLRYWMMFRQPNGTVTIRWAEEVPLEE